MNYYKNEVLRTLPAQELERVDPHLERVSFFRRQSIQPSNKPVRYLYFIESGIIAEISKDSSHVPVEVGLVGKDGVLGLSAFLYAKQAANPAVVQVAGEAYRLRLDKLRSLTNSCDTLNVRLMQCAYLTLTQLTGTILTNTRANMEHRLARWLLMAHDRIEGDIVPMTHDTLATMLGSPRPGISVALAKLAKDGLVEMHRGAIRIADRSGLEKFTGVFYGTPERERSRLLYQLG